MAYNEELAHRTRSILAKIPLKVEEKKMMGGLTFMVDDKMCVGILQDELMCRINPTEYEAALKRPGCREMNFTGKPMKGFVFITAEGTNNQNDLEYWVDLALHYNPLAKSSKKKK